MDKKFGFQIVGLLIISVVAIFYFFSSKAFTPASQVPFMPQTVKFKTVVINGVEIKAEVADTPEKRGKGLGGKKQPAENEGMLFIFERADKYPFWMKGLSYPLDFVWIKGDMVLDVTENVAQPTAGQTDESLPIYASKVDIDKVLELNAGTVQRLNIKLNDKIIIK